jgi:poly(3-hydroxybutyrate) depolymerase
VPELQETGRVGLLLLAALAGAPTQSADPIVSGSFMSEGVKRTYAAYAPPSDGPRPLVILLHGSGWTGRAMVERWKGLARREGIIVAGPDATDRGGWQPPQDNPTLFRDLVEELKPRLVDTRRIYLFGYSAGAVFALYMAPIESEYFAAAAAHAGAYGGEADLGFLDAATRRIPFFVSVGTKAVLFPLSLVNASVERLKRRGFPVEVSLLAGEGHGYQSSGQVNERAWRFLEQHRLATDPVFVPVRLGK